MQSRSSSTDQRSAPSSRSAIIALGALGLADIAFAFQQTAVIPAIPTIEHQFRAGSTWTAWLLSGYLVASSVATPLLGKLADLHGKRRLLSAALGLFLIGSVGAALAPSLAALIVFRALQGAGGAVFPLSLSIARERLPRGRVGVGIGLLTGAFGIGTTLGFAVSGAIVELASWRWVFGAGALAVLLALLPLPWTVPRSTTRAVGRLDLAGGGLLTGGVALLLVALTEGVPLGWGSWPVIVLFAGGLVGLAAWVVHDLRAPEPLIDLGILAHRPVLLTNLATLALGYALFAFYLLIPYLLAGGHGSGFDVGPLATGLYLLPTAVGQLLAGAASGFIAARMGRKATFTCGMALTAATGAWLALLHSTPWEVLIGMAGLGLGNGLAIGVASALITDRAPATQTGIATALNSVVRRVGGGVGSQISAAVLASAAVASGTPAMSTFAVAFWICAAVALAGTGLAAFIGPG